MRKFRFHSPGFPRSRWINAALPILLFTLAGRTYAAERASVSARLAAAEMTLEDRIAARFARQPEGENASATIGGEEVTSVVDGAEHPELLMPHELFSHLVQVTVAERQPQIRARYRAKFSNAARSATIPIDARFFDDLERVTREYRNLLKNARNGQLVRSRDVCASAHKAFVELEKIYGGALLRFLYVSVAPEMSLTSTDTAETHRQAEGGCQ